jgi:hypothetical protein
MAVNSKNHLQFLDFRGGAIKIYFEVILQFSVINVKCKTSEKSFWHCRYVISDFSLVSYNI